MIIHSEKKINELLIELNDSINHLVGSNVRKMETFHQEVAKSTKDILDASNLDYVAWRVICSREAFICMFELKLSIEEDKRDRLRNGKILGIEFIINEDYVSKTYNVIDEFTDITNRSINQTKFLIEMLNGKFDVLQELEQKIKKHHVFYCPGDMEEVKKILNI